jgi:hypothetical protein
MAFQVEVTETLTRVVEINAPTCDDAVRRVIERYEKEEIVLDSSDHIHTDIKMAG